MPGMILACLRLAALKHGYIEFDKLGKRPESQDAKKISCDVGFEHSAFTGHVL